MQTTHFLRGMTTVTMWAEDVAAARDWYRGLFGVEAYFERADDGGRLVYAEFRIGDDEDEFGIADARFAPPPGPGAGGVVLYWHVDDLAATVEQLLLAGATVHDKIRPRGDSGFVTASVRDPFGNVLGVMTNPHFAARHGGGDGGGA